ncbi:MAG TPA: M28 family peptidase [Thermoanaerobaculaceae bacterium]|nr:M28 family peptidase [Thermoanaerobaculaceae bacterium]HPS78143.1 M28 family peptidase [Thermoanaerobaculaceae bacterium]
MKHGIGVRLAGHAALVVMVCAAAAAAAAPRGVTPARAVQRITAASAFATVEELTSARYAGRLTGTAGYDAAAAWAVQEMRKAGLKAPAELPEYRQRFPVTVGQPETALCELLPGDDAGAPQRLEVFKDFAPFRLSGFGDVTAEVVFVGFGITAPKLGRDDYANLDVKGKVVMAVRGAPKDGREWQAYNSHKARIANARDHGAAGYVFAEGAAASVGGEHVANLPMVSITEDVANLLLAGPRLKLEDVRKVLSLGGVASLPTGRKVHLVMRGKPPRPADGFNVIGMVPGLEPGECVIVGGHLDHTGDWPALMTGADDNASGSAVVLEMARAAALVAPRPRRAIVFVLFGGEELGLLGAKRLVADLPASLGRVVAMLNFDMDGAGNGMFVLGGENFPNIWDPLVAAGNALYPELYLKRARSEGEARADHGPFQEAGIPAVSIFSSGGQHHGYHTPEDTVYFITPKIMEVIGRISLHAVFTLSGVIPVG